MTLVRDSGSTILGRKALQIIKLDINLSTGRNDISYLLVTRLLVGALRLSTSGSLLDDVTIVYRVGLIGSCVVISFDTFVFGSQCYNEEVCGV